MLTLYKRGRKWWARGTVHGRFLRTSLDTQFKEVAWKRLVDLELRGGRLNVKWPDFEKEFLVWKKPSIADSSYRKYKFVLARFARHLKSRGYGTVNDVIPEVMAGYAIDRQNDRRQHTEKPLGPEGLKADLRILHGVFSYAVKCGYLDKNPIIATKLNTTGGKTLPFTREEIARLLLSPYVTKDPKRHALVLTLLYTGLRIDDVSGLTKRALANKVLRTQKRKKDIVLTVHPDLATALEEHSHALNDAQRFSPYLFPTRTGRRFWSQSMDATLRRIFRHAGIDNGHAHRFRDTYAVRLLELGGTPYDISKLMGITLAVFERHYSPYVKELRERGQRLVEGLDFAPGRLRGGTIARA